MDRFLENYHFPTLNEEEVGSLNRPITSKDIETVIKKLHKNKSRGPDGFTVEFYQTFRVSYYHWSAHILPLILRLFQNIEKMGTLQNTFHETNSKLIPKADKDTTKKENYRKSH